MTSTGAAGSRSGDTGAPGSEPTGGRSPLPVDSLSLWEATAALPEQLVAALALADQIGEVVGQVVGQALGGAGRAARPAGAGAATEVLVVGMGAAGLAGDVLAAAADRCGTVPVGVVRSRALPGRVGGSTLVFAVSWSGATPETLAGARAAHAAGASVVAVTAPDGPLASWSGRVGVPVIPVDPSIPRSRAALGAMVVPLLVAYERLGSVEVVGVGAGGGVGGAGGAGGAGFDGGFEAGLREAASQLARHRDELVQSGSRAERIARRIGRTIPLVHGSVGLTAVAAHRWKSQVNANAKVPAFFSSHPELCSDELAGWGQHGDVTRQVFTLVRLRRADEPSSVAASFHASAGMLDEVVADLIEVPADGAGMLEQFFHHVLVGDLVSLHLAGREGVDPGPVPVVEEVIAAVRASE